MSDFFSAAFLGQLWQAVTTVGCAQTAAEFEDVPEIKALCRVHHAQLRQGLERLVNGGFLGRGTDAAEQHLVYVFTTACRPPVGYALPIFIKSANPFAVAQPRVHVAATMPYDSTKSQPPPPSSRVNNQLYPSRHGSRLTYPDGRITDLAGNPIKGAHA